MMDVTTRLSYLAKELAEGRIVEAPLRARDLHLAGLCDYGSGTIYIDPRTAIVSALLHELIHRRYPTWTETRVAREERRLIAHMTPGDVSRWYRAYLRAKRIRHTPKRVEG